MKEVDFFKQRKVKDSDFPDIIEALKYEFYKKGDTIMHWGDFGENFYILINGEVKVLVPSPKLKNSRDLMQACYDEIQHF